MIPKSGTMRQQKCEIQWSAPGAGPLIGTRTPSVTNAQASENSSAQSFG